MLTIAISTTGPIYKGALFEDEGEDECDGDDETSMMQSATACPSRSACLLVDKYTAPVAGTRARGKLRYLRYRVLRHWPTVEQR